MYIPNTDAIPSGEYYVRIEIEYPVFGNLNVIRYSWSSDKFLLNDKTTKNLFKGNYPLSQLFGVNPASYAKFGLKGITV